MKTNSKKNQWVSGICILTLISGMTLHSPIAHADDFGEVCSAIVQRVANGEKAENDVKAGKCVEADLAGKSAEWSKRKAIIQLAAAAVTGHQFFQEKTGKKEVKLGASQVAQGKKNIEAGSEMLKSKIPFVINAGLALIKGGKAEVQAGTKLIHDGAARITRARTVCPITAMTAGAGVLAIDVTGKYKINQIKTKYGQQQDKILDANILLSMAAPAAMFMMGDKSSISTTNLITNRTEFQATKDAICTPATCSDSSITPEQAQANTDAELKKKSACLGTTLLMGGMGAYSLIEKNNFEEIRSTNVELAKKVTLESEKGVNSISLGAATEDTKISNFNETKHRAESTSCANATGNAYLNNCVLAQAPETAAIINNSRLKNTIESRIGKNLGDFAKAYKGKTNADLANYVANATGVSASALGQFLNDSAKSKGGSLDGQQLTQEESRPESSFSRASGSSLLGSHSSDSDLDFSKMMNSLLGNLNGDPSDAEKKDSPAEAVFRRMDLLPADQIQANKDISLFARIAYRYRKKSDKLDPTLKNEMERTISSERK